MMKQKFPNIYNHLNQQWSYHDIDDVVYSAATRLLDYIMSYKTFQIYNHRMNSDQDVKKMFDELVDLWIDEQYIKFTDDEQSMRDYNILTDRDTNRVIKDDVFRLIRKK